MQRSLCLALAFLCGLSADVGAQNVSRLYPKAKLEADSAKFGEQLRAEFRETILPQLTEPERSALGAVKIEVPPVGRKGDPFEFYTDGHSVFLPALSLRFFSDLCVANAWLNTHGYDGTTVRDYVGYLFHEATVSASAPFPAVFETLGVPENARDETAVANRASREFGSAVFFLLAHELGHVFHQDRTDLNQAEQQRTQEIAADAFAIELMRRIGQIPFGLEFWFDLERIRYRAPTKIPTNAEWQRLLSGLDHPVTTERLNALAAAIEKAPEAFARNQTNPALWTARSKMFAQYFRMAAPFAGNSVARVAEYSRVLDLRKADLKPRKAAFSIPGLTTTEEADFNGLFRMRRKFADGRAAPEVDLLLLRSGDEVTGAYQSGNGHGSIEGKIADGVFRFTWKEGEARGRGQGTSKESQLAGSWGMGEQDSGGGTWEGARVRRQ